MIKLTKVKSSTWNGNGFGNTSAEWVVKGQENIVIANAGIWWTAVDTDTNKRLCRGTTKRDCVEALQEVFDVPEAGTVVKLGFGL